MTGEIMKREGTCFLVREAPPDVSPPDRTPRSGVLEFRLAWVDN